MDDPNAWLQLEPWVAEQGIRFLSAQAASWLRERRGKKSNRDIVGSGEAGAAYGDLEATMKELLIGLERNEGATQLTTAEQLQKALEVAIGHPILIDSQRGVRIENSVDIDISVKTVRGVLKGIGIKGGDKGAPDGVKLKMDVDQIEEGGEVIGLEMSDE